MDDPNLQAILGPDPEPFETLISNLTRTTNKEQRLQAESLFNLCKQTDPITLARKLVHLLEHSPHLDVRAMSAILLRNTLLQKPSEIRPSLWNSLPELRSRVKSCLLDCVRNRDNEPIIIILGNTISELAADNRFPEIMTFMFDGFENVEWLKKSALLIFAKLGEIYVTAYLARHQAYLHRVFMICLENGDLRITALSAVIKFIQCLDYSSRCSFKDLLPLMLKCVTEESNEARAQEALVLLIELAGKKWTFFDGFWPKFLEIAEVENLEEGTKHLAIEVVITYVEESKQYNLPQLIIISNSLCVILMRMFLDIEDEAAWHAAENEDEDAGESSNYIFGKQCLHRLATALGGDIIVPVVYEYLSAPNHEWQKHLAGLVALAQIAEDHSKLMNEDLEQVVTMVLNSIESHPDHPRVRWAAINAAGQLYADLDPHLRFEYHNHVRPALAKAMCEDPDPRVRLAVINVTVQLYALNPYFQFNYHSPVLPALADAMRVDPDPRVRLAVNNVTVQLYALNPYFQFNYHSPVLPALADAMRVDPDPRVRLAAINAAGQLSADLNPYFQFEYNSHVLPSLADAMRADPDPHVRLAAINVTVQLFADLDPDLTLTDENHDSVLQALHGAICDFEYLLVQDGAAFAMIKISMKYPEVTPRYLPVTVGTLLRRRREEDIASDQTSIRAIRKFLQRFEARLPHETWTSTFNRLHRDQQAEVRSILEHGI